jgi:hypothetical protein
VKADCRDTDIDREFSSALGQAVAGLASLLALLEHAASDNAHMIAIRTRQLILQQ